MLIDVYLCLAKTKIGAQIY